MNQVCGDATTFYVLTYFITAVAVWGLVTSLIDASAGTDSTPPTRRRAPLDTTPIFKDDDE